MNPQEFARLCQGVTAELTALDCGEWAVVPLDEGRPAAELHRADGARLYLTASWQAGGKVTVTALEPSTYTGGEYHQSRKYARHVDPARGTRAIAVAARTYILNAGYLDALPEKVAQNVQRMAEEGERANIMADAAGLFGLEGPGDAPLSLHRFTGKKAEAEVIHERYGGRPVMSLELHGLPPDIGLAMLAAMAQAYSGHCCHIYGPGHPPQFEVFGCLREKSERGKQASRRRVVALLKEHGAGPLAITEALDQARESRYRVAEVEADGQVVGVVQWDYDGCGEFTVELAGRDGHGY